MLQRSLIDVRKQWEQADSLQELLQLSVWLAGSGEGRTALERACRTYAISLVRQIAGGEYHSAITAAAERMLGEHVPESELAELRSRTGGGASTAFGQLQNRNPGAAQYFAALGLLTSDALSCVEYVIRHAIRYRVFSVIRRHPDWAAIELNEKATRGGVAWRTSRAFLARHPDFEALVTRREVLGQIIFLRDALRPVLFPHAPAAPQPTAAVETWMKSGPGTVH